MNLGKITEKREDFLLTSQNKKVSLDNFHKNLPFDIGDHLIFFPSKSKILCMVPNSDEDVEHTILKNDKWKKISPLFRRLILTKVKKYISSNSDNEIFKRNEGKNLSVLLNVISWKTVYHCLGDELLKEIIDTGGISNEAIKCFINLWTHSHLFRQFELWGICLTDVKSCFEQMIIGCRGKYTIEDFMLVLAENPFRFYVLGLEKIRKIQMLFDSQNPHPEILKYMKILNGALPYRTYVEIFDDVSDEVKNLSKTNNIKFFKHKLQSFVACSHVYEIELSVFSHLLTKIRRSKLDKISKESNIIFSQDLSDEQIQAVKMVFQNPISIITGGPGTGKTKIIKDIIDECIRKRISYHVAAFTGKAVARVRETVYPLQISSSTIDMMISRGNEYYDFKLLILEEASMITTKNLYRLFQEFSPLLYSIVFVGDVNQIPPIEWGHIFYSLMLSDCVPMQKLTHNYRVDKNIGKEIILASNKIINPPKHSPLEFENSFSFKLMKGNPQSMEKLFEQECVKNIMKKLIILTPYNENVKFFNSLVQSSLFSIKTNKFLYNYRSNRTWFVGDRVMVLKNNASLDIMNGDVGHINSIGDDNLTVCFDDNKKILFYTDDIDKYPKISDNLQLSYSLTINKSQGSEYDYVFLFVPKKDSNPFFLNRNLIYTAITRAKLLAWVICEDLNDFQAACRNKLPKIKDMICYKLKDTFPSAKRESETSDGENEMEDDSNDFETYEIYDESSE